MVHKIISKINDIPVLSRIYALSFLWLFPLVAVSPYVTAQWWADMVAMITVLLGLYDLIYILILRRKDNVSFGRAVARFPLYLFSVVFTGIIFYYIKLFFFGYNLFGYNQTYGFKAIFYDVWDNLVFVPCLIITSLYIGGYYFISKKISKRR